MLDSLHRLSLILATITDGILVVDTQGIVLYANQAAEQILERTPLVGQSLAIPIVAQQTEHQDINLIRQSGFAWAEMRSTPIEWEGASAFVIGLRDISARKRAELALQESENLFQTLARVAPVGIFRTNAQGHCEYVNKRWCEISGLTAEHAMTDGWLQAIMAGDRPRVDAEWQQSIQSRTPFNSQYRFQLNNGAVHWVIGRAMPEFDASGHFSGCVGTITDITDIKFNEESLRQAAAVFETTHEGVMITDADCRIQLVNRAFSEITGYGLGEVLDQRPSVLSSGRHGREFYQTMWTDISATDHWQGEIWNRRKNGEIYPELLSISAVRNQAGAITNYVGVFADISKLKSSEMELEFLAHHDPLTQLPNRVLFLSRLQHSIDKSHRDSKQLAVLMLDLDRFKDVNDSFGHPAGDDLLRMVSERLLHRLRATDTICRLGGDEFMVLLEEINHAEAAARVADSIIAALSEIWRLPMGNEVRIGVSVGIALFPEHGTAAAELIQHADTALYQAKKEGRNRFKYFSEDLTRAARARMELEFHLRQAIEKDELRLYFQPQIDIGSGLIVGAEALIRWQNAKGEIISPADFIPIAEETGLIVAIGNWVLQATCRQGKRWLDQGGPPLRLSVNLSSQQFLHSDICDVIAETLAKTGFSASYLELEITESAVMQREQEAIDILHRLHKLGVHLAIDDFGTGYSSLAYLKLFPLDVLKIDKSFIQDIPHHSNGMEITATIIAMAKTLGMRVIAEGVETSSQLAFLRERNCDLYQGYYTSKPVPPEEFERLLANYNRNSGATSTRDSASSL